MYTTSVSLLERLRSPAERVAAWDRFAALYTPLMYHWARRLGLQETDAADLVQDVFSILVRKLPDFHYDDRKRFRAWLWTVVRNKHHENARRHEAARDEPLPDDLSDHADPHAAAAEAEERQILMHRALQLIQTDFEPTTWKAFWELAVAGRPAADVAAELGLVANAVYAAKFRVLKRLREEFSGLLD